MIVNSDVLSRAGEYTAVNRFERYIKRYVRVEGGLCGLSLTSQASERDACVYSRADDGPAVFCTDAYLAVPSAYGSSGSRYLNDDMLFCGDRKSE